MMYPIPDALDERPETFHCVGMNLTDFPFFAPVERLVLHLLTDFIIPTILIGNQLGIINLDEPLDKLNDRLSGGVFYKLCDDLAT